MTSARHKTRASKFLLLIAVLVSWGCGSGIERPPEGTLLKLSLAVSPATYSALIAVADEKGYFREAGLDVSLALYPSGQEALDAVCREKAQVATVSDISFSARALTDPSIRVLASIATTIRSQIVARRDKNIQNPSDLRGKRIGFSPDTVSDYFLYSFLMTENIPLKEVAAVAISPARQVEAIENGEVDAVSAFEIFAFVAKKRLGKNAVFWDSQNNLPFHWLLATRESLTQSPEPLKRLLKALIRAEHFARSNEEETKHILARRWGFDPAFLRDSWPSSRLNVSFSQSMVISLQNYARWEMRKEGKIEDPPDVLKYFCTGIMDEVDPGLVTILR